MMFRLTLLFLLLTYAAIGQVPPGYPPDTLDIFPRLKAARALGQTEPDSAARELRALVALSQRARLPRWESRIRYRLGDLFVRGQQQADASAEAFAILRLARNPADPDPAAEMLGLVLLGDVYFSRSDFVGAARYHRQAYELALRVGTPKEQGRMGASLGNTLSSGKHPEEAVRMLQRSTELLLAAGDTITAVSCLSAEAEALRTIKQLARAEAVSREALRFYDYPVLRADVMAREATRIHLARIVLDRGQAAEALQMAQYVEQKAREVESPMLRQAALLTLAESAQALRQFQLAFTAERHLRLLNDSTNSAAVAEQIAALSTRYDAERRETRIRELTQQRRIERLAAERTASRARWLAAAAVVLALGVAFFGWLYVALRRSQARLAASEAAARQLNTTQSRLLSVIGHDARGPLLAVEVVSQLVEQQAAAPDPAELRAIALEMRETTTSVRSLLDNLLYWAHGQTGQLVNQPKHIRPAEVLIEVGKLYAPVATVKGVELHVEPADDLPAVWADPNLIHTVLRNLVANAIKFTPAGGKVTVSASPTDKGVAFRVKDTGQGLSPERLAQLLNPPQGPNEPTSTPGTGGEGGTGLGLAVCRQFAALLGQGLMGESMPGAGSTFGVVVPTRP
jgi:signal transduction histidine kinase